VEQYWFAFRRRLLMIRCACTVLFAASICGALGTEAQSPLDGSSTQVRMRTDMSSNSAIVALLASPVTGKPYEAEKVTRSEWHLADGTVITHEGDTKIARDGEGRIREEIEHTNAASIGGRQMNHTAESVTIADPVSHSLLIMSGPKPTMALRMQMPDFAKAASRPRTGGVTGILETAPPPAPVRLGVAAGSSADVRLAHGTGNARDEVRREDLGEQSLAGLLVKGTRTTTTIPLGEIGNDRPITITHEQWYSPDLKLVVKSEDNDPRSGKQTMELQGLTLGEPSPALFQAPEGVTVREMPDMTKMLRSGAQEPVQR
jgi:hypothetical protein